MTLRLAATLFLAVIGLVSTPAAAQGISQTDRAAIQTRINAFDAIMKEGRIAETLDFVPPLLLEMIAKKFGGSTQEFRPHFAAQIAEMMKSVKFVSFGMALNAATAGVTPDKSRSYLLIPTETVIEMVGAGRMLGKSATLALKDQGTWYLIRIEDADQISLLREAYPEFAGVEFPAGSMTAIE